MKTLVRIVLSLIVLLAIVFMVAYVDGASLPVDHVTTISDVVPAPPAKVFALITDVANAPKWRPQVQSVQVLPPDAGRDHWIEDLGHGVKMNFLATETEPISAAAAAKRVVHLSDPTYGGDWTYVLAPGPEPGQTLLIITETGFIKPPIYRFLMQHVFGMKKNLNDYMTAMKAAAVK